MMKWITPRFHAWWLLWLALLIAMTNMLASQWFTQRIERFLDLQASELLAADLIVSSVDPIAQDILDLSQNFNLNQAETVELRTAIFVDDSPQLVELKAVSDTYPLRGSLQWQASLSDSTENRQTGPKPGTVWVDQKLVNLIGQPLSVGLSTFPIDGILSFEPDRSGSLFNLAPRVMMSLDDLANTQLIVPGSRARYKLLLAGDAAEIIAFQQAVEPLLTRGQQLQSLKNARPEMRNALERTDRFFSLSILMTLVISMVAISLTARYAAGRETTQVSVLRTFGISSKRLLRFYSAQLIKIWVLALIPSLALGWLAQTPLQWAMGLWFQSQLPAVGWQPILMAGLIGLIGILGFSFPPLLQVVRTPPMQVLRKTAPGLSAKSKWINLLVSLLTLGLILQLLVSEFKMAFSLLLTIGLLGFILPWLIRSSLKTLSKLGASRFWANQFVISRLLSDSRQAIYVMAGFSITLLAVLLITQVKNQLITDWESQLPPDRPNYFLVNIPDEKVEPLSAFLDKNLIEHSGLYPMIRARLSAINEQAVDQVQFESNRANRLKNHTFNLSYSSDLPSDNQVTSGEWLGQSSSGLEWSIEHEMAEDMMLKLGDTVSFELEGSTFIGTVTSFRSVVWENFKPNFFVIGTETLLADKAKTWLLSAKINPDQKTLLKPLVQQFPSLILLDIGEMMQRIKGIMNRAGLALQFFFAFALFSASVVLMAALKMSHSDRQKELALLSALGASRKQLLRSQWLEFLAMGTVVGVLSATLAWVIGNLLATQFFGLDWALHPQLWFISLISAILVISVVGLLMIYPKLKINPMQLLRG